MPALGRQQSDETFQNFKTQFGFWLLREGLNLTTGIVRVIGLFDFSCFFETKCLLKFELLTTGRDLPRAGPKQL